MTDEQKADDVVRFATEVVRLAKTLPVGQDTVARWLRGYLGLGVSLDQAVRYVETRNIDHDAVIDLCRQAFDATLKQLLQDAKARLDRAMVLPDEPGYGHGV